MDRLTERLDRAARALATLEAVPSAADDRAIERDAALIRFVYSFEALWKAAQAWLVDREGLEIASPRAAIRAARAAGLLDDATAESLMVAAADRNLVVHAYNEALARAIAGRLARHAAALRRWLDAMTAAVRERDNP